MLGIQLIAAAQQRVMAIGMRHCARDKLLTDAPSDSGVRNTEMA